MKRGMQAPRWRFADTLPLFKVAVSSTEGTELLGLVDKYMAWFDDMHRNSASDAAALKFITMTRGRKLDASYPLVQATWPIILHRAFCGGEIRGVSDPQRACSYISYATTLSLSYTVCPDTPFRFLKIIAVSC